MSKPCRPQPSVLSASQPPALRILLLAFGCLFLASFSARSQPANDNLAACTALGGAAGSHADNNTAATKEAGEPDHAGDPGGKSLWYCWTATGTNAVTFDTIGSSF